ncbi:MAG: fasciclin domain-containing protein [Sedimentisphaerales bacterium]|nr:fasciclin domain-containing protein [Sedimentisphaerales bacterium]
MSTNKTRILVFVQAVLMAVWLVGCQNGHRAACTAAKQDIVDTAVQAGSFNTLVTAIKAADLVDALKGPGPFTVFAPTDEAFAKLPSGTVDSLLRPENKDKLADILKYHVVSGKVLAKDVTGLHSATTLLGKDLKIRTSGNGVMINDAKVVQTDIMCKNGVIHVVDTVILP